MNRRYSRQELFKPIGLDGQQKLAKESVAIIGCGALGSSITETLVRAGVGTLHLVDRDFVEMSNLQRQQLFTEADALDMTPKVEAAKKRLQAIRSDVNIITYFDNADGPLMEKLTKHCALLVDATDNFETRLLINDAAHKAGIPWVYGACVGGSGTVFTFVPQKTACFRCLLPNLPSLNETCDTVGIIAPAVHITAAHQCTEIIKWLTGHEDKLRTKVYHFDVWHHTHLEIGISRIKKQDCPTCGHSPSYPSLAYNSDTNYIVLCGRDAIQVIPDSNRSLTLDDAESLAIKQGYDYKRTPYFVQFYIEEYRIILFSNGRMLIHGVNNLQEGRKIYHQLFG